MRLLAILIGLGMFCLLPLCAEENSIPASHQAVIAQQWIPTHNQTEKALEAALEAVRQTAQRKGTTAGEKYTIEGAAHISRDFGTYAVQFVGQIRNGKKVIFCNFFPGKSISDQADLFKYWKSGVIYVDDGGYNYWQVTYDPETGKCDELQINGMG